MRSNRHGIRWVVGILAVLSSGEADASFTYSVSVVPTSVSFGNSNMQVVPAFPPPTTSGVLAGNQIINLAQVFQTTTTAPQPPTRPASASR